VEIKDDRFIIDTNPRDERGVQLSPEEKPAAHELLIDVPLTANGLSGEAQILGNLRAGGAIQEVGTVAQFAHGVKHTCSLCKWFSNEGWLKAKASLETMAQMGDKKQFDALMTVYGMFMDQFSGLTPDHPRVQAAVRTLGVCQAQMAVYGGETCVVPPEGGCPTEPGPKGEDLTKLFEPRDSDTQKAGINLYDAIMRAAQGK